MARAARFEFEVVDEVTSEEHQFRKALEEAPHDVLARCAYADWLAERGRVDDELVQRLLGTRVVLVHDRRPGYGNAEATWDLFLPAGDLLARFLVGAFLVFEGDSAEWCGLDELNRDYLAPVLGRGYDPFCRHCYRSPAEAEADLLRAYRLLLREQDHAGRPLGDEEE